MTYLMARKDPIDFIDYTTKYKQWIIDYDTMINPKVVTDVNNWKDFEVRVK